MAPRNFELIYTLTCQGGRIMGTYGLEGVVRAWEREQLTTEQAIGQILLLLQEIEERIRRVEYRLERYAERIHRLK
jgi:hypothetical protein